MIGMQPSEFWDTSLHEIEAAISGFLEFNGSNEPQPMDRARLNELMELYPD